MYNYKNGKWANKILSMQHPDGSWGCFHTLRSGSKTPITTEQALTRLENLGYTENDECIKKSICYMETLLEGLTLPEGNEKSSDFDVFVQLMAFIKKAITFGDFDDKGATPPMVFVVDDENKNIK